MPVLSLISGEMREFFQCLQKISRAHFEGFFKFFTAPVKENSHSYDMPSGLYTVAS